MSHTDRLTLALADRYRIIRHLGTGGMASVYLAEDLKHERQVAIKVLKPELAAVLGAERFVVEIKTTAALQHPGILPLFDSGTADGFLFYVMPYIEGETIRDRLNRETQLGVDEAVRLTREIADALDYAHRRGIIHRDVKPENLLLHDGRALVMDFGIALAVSAAAGGRMTETGLSLGTPHYMSPEQATADKDLTARSDVYSLASVLYEMLTGNPPHTGSSAQQIIMKIITEPAAPVTQYRKTVPPHVAAAVARGLEKLPADRFATAKEFSDALGTVGFTQTVASAASNTRAALAAPRTRIALAALPWLVTAAALAWGLTRDTASSPPPVTRFAIARSGNGEPRDAAGSPIAVSPDGRSIAYVGSDSLGGLWLYLRAIDNLVPQQLAGTNGATAPVFSPDGRQLAFLQESRIKAIDLGSGSISPLLTQLSTNSLSWGSDGHFYFTDGGQLLRTPVSGGAVDTLLKTLPHPDDLLRWPDVLPDGRGVLLTLVRGGSPMLALYHSGENRLIEFGIGGMYPRWVSPSWVVYAVSGGTVVAASFDVKTMAFTGPASPIADNVRTGPAFPIKGGVGRDGTIAFLPGSEGGSNELVVTDRSGAVQQRFVAPDRSFFGEARFSPDGRRALLAVIELAQTNRRALWTADFQARSLSRLTFDSAAFGQAWSPDGRYAYYSTGATLRRVATDGSGKTDSLFTSPAGGISEIESTPDGAAVVMRYYKVSSGFDRDIGLVPLDGRSPLQPWLNTTFNESAIDLSPDGQWLLYSSNESGQSQVYVRRASAVSGRWPVTTGRGGATARWGARGREIVFASGDSMTAVSFTPGEEPTIGPARKLFADQTFLLGGNATPWDVSPQGDRLLTARRWTEDGRLQIEVIANWFAQRSPTGK
ncbi:protein kinase [Pseudogemmatithrix spongiicola]|uniref:non-specific serine/threonine protein kinase n=1 Tax=Pseudogemmatithrix spongiicola TaxID=3062599 RepID=A0AA49JYD9_9BACT|nr:protein kinase [Gemmatimonadaceae bacterium 'strain 138']WKW14296.1 protein kinase [Gemmatimonadaceae bacterium 'strain 318']